ncbi:MAG: hypothetical protein SNH35_04555 [Rikenellaceae bacterium]
MKWIDINAFVAFAKYEMIKLCKKRGYEPDGLDLAENLASVFDGDDCIKLSYTTEDYEVYMIAEIEPERLVAIEIDLVKL